MIALLAQWRGIGVATLVAVSALAVGWGLLERARKAELEIVIADQRSQLDEATRANVSLQETLAGVRAAHARQLATLADQGARAAARAARAQHITEGVVHARSEEDGPIAPVLSDVLVRLRSGAAPPGRKPAGEGDSPPIPADMPGQP